MPSVLVTPASPVESPVGGPVIAGVVFRRPVRRRRSYEPVRSTHELANGNLRSYVVGRRVVVELSWTKLTETEVATLAELVAPAFVTYADDSESPSFVVSTDEPLEVDPVPGTFPIRAEATLRLRGRDVT